MLEAYFVFAYSFWKKNILDWSLIVHFSSVWGTRDCERTVPGDLSLQALVCQSVCFFNSQAVA